MDKNIVKAFCDELRENNIIASFDEPGVIITIGDLSNPTRTVEWNMDKLTACNLYPTEELKWSMIADLIVRTWDKIRNNETISK